MRIPKIFLPENKNLEDKVEQLAKEPKTHEKECRAKHSEELEKLLSKFYPPYVDYDLIHSEVTDLAENMGYKQINKKSSYEYWVKPTGFGESYVLVSFGKKSEKYYMFARIKDENFEKFCNKLEYQRKMICPKSFILTGFVLSASLTMSYVCSSSPIGNFLKDVVSWMMPSMFTIPAVLSIPSIVQYMRRRIGKGLDKYCIGLIIGDDRKALEAAFS